MRDFRQWIDQRIEEAIASPRLIREVGEGIWISPSDEVFKFKDLTHAEWAKAAELDVSEMLHSGWVRLRVLADEVFAETERHSAVWPIVQTAEEYGQHKVRLYLKSREMEVRKGQEGWLLDGMPISYVFENVHRSSILSKLQLEMLDRPSYSAVEVIDVLNKGGVECVLVGAQMLGHYTGEPRATQDVDVVVNDVERAVRVVRAKWPHFTFDDQQPVVRVRDGEFVVIDLMKPVDLYGKVFANSITGTIGNVKILIPTPELAVAMKYAAMISTWRKRGKRHIDVGDFIHLVESQPKLDVEKVGQFVAYLWAGAEDEVKKYIDDVRNDRPMTV